MLIWSRVKARTFLAYVVGFLLISSGVFFVLLKNGSLNSEEPVLSEHELVAAWSRGLTDEMGIHSNPQAPTLRSALYSAVSTLLHMKGLTALERDQALFYIRSINSKDVYITEGSIDKILKLFESQLLANSYTAQQESILLISLGVLKLTEDLVNGYSNDGATPENKDKRFFGTPIQIFERAWGVDPQNTLSILWWAHALSIDSESEMAEKKYLEYLSTIGQPRIQEVSYGADWLMNEASANFGIAHSIREEEQLARIEKHYNIAYTIYESLGFKEHMAGIEFDRGERGRIYYSHDRDMSIRAIEQYRRATVLFQQVGRHRDARTSSLLTSRVYENMGDYEEAEGVLLGILEELLVEAEKVPAQDTSVEDITDISFPAIVFDGINGGQFFEVWETLVLIDLLYRRLETIEKSSDLLPKINAVFRKHGIFLAYNPYLAGSVKFRRIVN